MEPRSRRCLDGLAVVAIVAATAVLGAGAASAEESAFSFPEGTVTAPVGMATDHAARRYWAVQGATGTLTVQTFDAEGDRAGSVSSRDRVTSVQGLAFTAQQLFIGDVGGRRQRVTILKMDRPVPGTQINRSIAIALEYPDGAHDAAAIMADADQKLFVVTRGQGAGLYAAPDDPSAVMPWQTAAPGAKANPLTRVGEAPPDVTDASFLVDGRIALRSASRGVVVLDPATFAEVASQAVTVEQKGLALTQSLDQRAVLVAAGPEGAVTSLAVPGVPPARPTAMASRRASEPTVVSEEPVDRTYEQTGTSVALGAAAALALLAAAVALLRR